MAYIQEQAHGLGRASGTSRRCPGDAGNWGGSWLTRAEADQAPGEATELAKWLTAPEQQAKVFRATGNFPSTVALYDDPVIKDLVNPFFSNAPVGQIFSESVTDDGPAVPGAAVG